MKKVYVGYTLPFQSYSHLTALGIKRKFGLETEVELRSYEKTHRMITDAMRGKLDYISVIFSIGNIHPQQARRTELVKTLENISNFELEEIDAELFQRRKLNLVHATATNDSEKYHKLIVEEEYMDHILDFLILKYDLRNQLSYEYEKKEVIESLKRKKLLELTNNSKFAIKIAKNSNEKTGTILPDNLARRAGLEIVTDHIEDKPETYLHTALIPIKYLTKEKINRRKKEIINQSLEMLMPDSQDIKTQSNSTLI